MSSSKPRLPNSEQSSSFAKQNMTDSEAESTLWYMAKAERKACLHVFLEQRGRRRSRCIGTQAFRAKCAGVGGSLGLGGGHAIDSFVEHEMHNELGKRYNHQSDKCVDDSSFGTRNIAGFTTRSDVPQAADDNHNDCH